MVRSEKKFRAILRKSSRTSNWRTVFSLSMKKRPIVLKKKLRATPLVDYSLYRMPLRPVIKTSFINLTRAGRTFSLRGTRSRTKGNWQIKNLSRVEETAGSCLSSPSFSMAEWDALSSSSRIGSPAIPKTGKQEVGDKTELTVEIAPKKVTVTQQKSEEQDETKPNVKIDSQKYDSQKGGSDKRSMIQLRKKLKVDSKIDPLPQPNEKPEVQAETKTNLRMDPKKYVSRKGGFNELLVNQLREKPDVDVETKPTVKLESTETARRQISINQHPISQFCNHPKVQAESKMTAKGHSKKCASPKAGTRDLHVPGLCEKPEVEAETFKLDFEKYGPRKAGFHESFVTQSSDKLEVDSETVFTVQMDRIESARPKAGAYELSVTQLGEKPDTKSIFELDPKKYVLSQADMSDPSMTRIDGDDCCIIFENSVSSLQSREVDLIGKAVEKEKEKIINEKYSPGSLNLETTPPSLWRNFTARVDGTTIKKLQCSMNGVKDGEESQKVEVDKERSVSQTQDLQRSFTLECVSGAERMIDDQDIHASSHSSSSVSEVADVGCLYEDSDEASPIRDLPFYSPEKRGESGRSLDDSEQVLPAQIVDTVLTKEVTVPGNQEEEWKEENEKVPTTEITGNDVHERGTMQDGGDTVIERVPVVTQMDIDERKVAEDPRHVAVDAETNTTSQSGQRRRCHCRTTNLRLRRLRKEVVHLKKLLHFRTRTYKADRGAYAELLKDNRKVTKSVLRLLRLQASLNERLVTKVSVENLRVGMEKQSSSTQTEPHSEVDSDESSPGASTPPLQEATFLAPTSALGNNRSGEKEETSRRLSEDMKNAKRKAKRLLSLSQPCNSIVPVGWNAIRQRAAEMGRRKGFSLLEEQREKDSPQETFNRTSCDSSDSLADVSLQNNAESLSKLSSFQEEAKMAQGLQAVYEDVKADEDAEEVRSQVPKKRKRIRFQQDEDKMVECSQPENIENEIGTSQLKRIHANIKTPSSLKDDRASRGKVKSKLMEVTSSPDDDSWNDYVKDLVGRLAQDYSTIESQTVEGGSQKNVTCVEFQNEDILSFLFLDEQIVFTTRKIDPAFKGISHDDAALARIVSQLRAKGDIEAAEKEIHAAGILNCANFDNIRKQLRQYLKVFTPLVCYYFQVHLDIQTGHEELRVIVTEARCRDDLIDSLEGYKVSVKSTLFENLPKLVADDPNQEGGKVTVVVGPASFINQDSSPNVKYVSLNRHTVGVVAVRDILPGEELLISHGIGFCCKKKKVNHPRKVKEQARYERSF